jgi:hypothetical protein
MEMLGNWRATGVSEIHVVTAWIMITYSFSFFLYSVLVQAQAKFLQWGKTFFGLSMVIISDDNNNESDMVLYFATDPGNDGYGEHTSIGYTQTYSIFLRIPFYYLYSQNRVQMPDFFFLIEGVSNKGFMWKVPNLLWYTYI